MPPFASHPLKSNPVHRLLRKHPSLFGVPFLVIIVGASFAMQSFTQTRYDLHDQKVTQLSKEQELGLGKSRKKFDIREEYFRLNTAQDADWEPKRIERPKGLPEWESLLPNHLQNRTKPDRALLHAIAAFSSAHAQQKAINANTLLDDIRHPQRLKAS